jgi:uncharacterized coiled-coil protein SlyX
MDGTQITFSSVALAIVGGIVTAAKMLWKRIGDLEARADAQDKLIAELRNQLLERDRKILVLEQENSTLKGRVASLEAELHSRLHPPA